MEMFLEREVRKQVVAHRLRTTAPDRHRQGLLAVLDILQWVPVRINSEGERKDRLSVIPPHATVDILSVFRKEHHIIYRTVYTLKHSYQVSFEVFVGVFGLLFCF